MARPRSKDKKRINRFRTNSNRAFGRFLAAQIDSDGNNHNLVDPNASLDSQTSDPASLQLEFQRKLDKNNDRRDRPTVS